MNINIVSVRWRKFCEKTKVDTDRHADNNRQHFIRIKYKSFLPLPNKADEFGAWILFVAVAFSIGFRSHTVCTNCANIPFSKLCVFVWNGTNCIGCIQLYYIRIEIAGLKFNLSFQTNYLFLRRKLFHSFMYLEMRGYTEGGWERYILWYCLSSNFNGHFLFRLFSSIHIEFDFTRAIIRQKRLKIEIELK